MKSKAGLHKKISSIFDGVPIPGPGSNDPTAQSSLAGRGGGAAVAPGQASAEGNTSSLTVAMSSGGTERTEAARPGRTASAPKKSWLKASAGGTAKSGNRPVGKIAVVGILAVVLIVVLVMALGQPAPGKAGQTSAKVEKDTTVAKKASADIPVWPILEPYPTGLRDPMVLVEPPKPVEETPEIIKQELFVLKGVVLGEKGNTAIVGSDIVSVGDQIQGARIIRIDRGEVEFEKDGQRWVQTVSP